MFAESESQKMSGWIEVKKDKKKKGDSNSAEDARPSLSAAAGQAAVRAVFWGETTKKAAAKLEAYDREHGRHGDTIVMEADVAVAKPAGIPDAEAIGAAFTWTRIANVLNPLKQRLKTNPPRAEVDSIVRQIVNMLDSDFRKATDCKWCVVLVLHSLKPFGSVLNISIQAQADQHLALPKQRCERRSDASRSHQ